METALGNDEMSTCLLDVLLSFALCKQANQQGGGGGLEERVYTINPNSSA